MITIGVTRNPEKIKEMIPHFIVENENERVQLVNQLAKMLVEESKDLLVVEARVDGELDAFIVAEVMDQDRVYIVQAWSDSERFSTITELFLRVVLWANALGRSIIEARSKRNAEVLYRRFGFEETAVVFQHKISPDLSQVLVRSAKEVLNGQLVQQTKK